MPDPILKLQIQNLEMLITLELENYGTAIEKQIDFEILKTLR